jgi:hypothetical protein
MRGGCSSSGPRTRAGELRYLESSWSEAGGFQGWKGLVDSEMADAGDGVVVDEADMLGEGP